MEGRVKLFHANMLKKYVERKKPDESVSVVTDEARGTTEIGLASRH